MNYSLVLLDSLTRHHCRWIRPRWFIVQALRSLRSVHIENFKEISLFSTHFRGVELHRYDRGISYHYVVARSSEMELKRRVGTLKTVDFHIYKSFRAFYPNRISSATRPILLRGRKRIFCVSSWKRDFL